MVVLTPASPPLRREGVREPLPPPLPGTRGPARVRARAALWRFRFALAAVCLGAAAAVTLQTLRPPPAPTVPVVVLAHDVSAGTALAAGDVVVADVPAAAAPADALRTPSDAHGHVAAVDLPARLPVTPTLLTGAVMAGPAGTVVVAVRLDDPAVAGLLKPGLHLDLVAARLEGGPGETVARRALVRPAPDGEAAPGGLLGTTSPDDGPPVLVAVTPDEALLIAQASVSSRLVAVVVP
ncbi:SAF domain-containing protein [Cellulomonas xiejunii]|uniref:SAF domain-containing protein n=1 Tax=Cellulomonas xiejunii TaxID=2968083 RepID=A0ABY5KQB1_9CELL|nr:SAF domain-containing protein [Cellulomonas xiejunii]MCC2322654.1 SAF domain-containing protein [Cellulomonas xiejunii]UUI72692.1 SAF domain-containing protein [Cellulomonas xiejunii]